MAGGLLSHRGKTAMIRGPRNAPGAVGLVSAEWLPGPAL